MSWLIAELPTSLDVLRLIRIFLHNLGVWKILLELWNWKYLSLVDKADYWTLNDWIKIKI